MQIKRDWIAITSIGTLIVFMTLWVPWLFVPAEVSLIRDGYQDMISPGSSELMGGLTVMENGLHGAMDVGVFIPSWIFILLIVASGIITILNITRTYIVSFWIPMIPIIISSIMLIYWAGSSLAVGCKLDAGFPIALIGIGMISYVTIKNNQMENKSHHATTGSGGVCDDLS
jgi:hypothetical protein